MDKYVIYNESLQASVVCYHAVWDQWHDVDPLSVLGAVEGVLPNRPPKEALMLRDILIQWLQLDNNFTWENLPMGIDHMVGTHLSIKDLIEYESEDGTFYSLHARLLEIGMIVLALHQIISAFSKFFYGTDSNTFMINKDFSFLCQLAWHDKPEEMIAIYIVLQRRCNLAVKHIQQNFNKLIVNQTDAYSISSYDSTTRSECSRIDNLTP